MLLINGHVLESTKSLQSLHEYAPMEFVHRYGTGWLDTASSLDWPFWTNAERDLLRLQGALAILPADPEKYTGWAGVRDGRAQVVVIVSKNTWESEHYEAEIGRLEIYAQEQADPVLVRDTVVATLRDALSRFNFQHISCFLPSAAVGLMSWLNRLGFNTIDLRGRFLLQAAQRENLVLRNAAKTLLWPECQVEEVAEALNQIEFPSRFAADNFFSPGKVKEMYSRWVLGGLQGNMPASVFRGLRRNGRITALAYAQEMTVGYGAATRSVYGRILAGAVLGKGSDCYYVINDMTVDCLARCDWVEAVISLNNRVPVKSVHSMGYRLHATELVLHARLE